MTAKGFWFAEIAAGVWLTASGVTTGWTSTLAVFAGFVFSIMGLAALFVKEEIRR